MKCCQIKVGELKTKIALERAVFATDEVGGRTVTWSSLATTYGKLFTLSGVESFSAARVTPTKVVRAVIRFRGDSLGAPYYTTKDRALIRGRYYDIIAVIDIDYERRFLQLDMVEGFAS